MTITVTLDQPVKPGDNLALVVPPPFNIQAGATLLFAVDSTPVILTTKSKTPLGWWFTEIETYEGDREIPAKSSALILFASSVE
jgi:hypothetical protein